MSWQQRTSVTAGSSLVFICLIAVLFVVTAFLQAEEKPFLDYQRTIRQVSRQGEQVVLDGVRWGFDSKDCEQPRYPMTTIDLSRVREVHYWSQRFFPECLAAHGMLAFFMDSADAVTNDKGEKAAGLVLSVEARYREGQFYNPIAGLGKTYRIIYQMTTLSDRIQWAMSMWKQNIHRFRLKLSREQCQKLLRYTLAEAELNRDDEWYDTVHNSCVSNAFRLVNEVLEPERKIKQWRIPNVLYDMRLALPNMAAEMIVELGVAEELPMLPVSTEPVQLLPDFVVDVVANPGKTLASAEVAFATGLTRFADLAAAADVLDRLLALQSPGSDYYWVCVEEQNLLADGLFTLQQALLDTLDNDVEGLLPYYKAAQLPPSTARADFEASLSQRLRHKLLNGELADQSMLVGLGD